MTWSDRGLDTSLPEAIVCVDPCGPFCSQYVTISPFPYRKQVEHSVSLKREYCITEFRRCD